jgi:hypothetical protein
VLILAVSSPRGELASVLLGPPAMKAHRWPLVLLPVWVACSDSPSQLPDDSDSPPPVTVHVTSAQAPVLVAFRDGFDARWQLATPGIAVDVTVHRAYTVAVVCQEPDAWRTWQFSGYAQFLNDTLVTTPCAAPPARHKVTGRVARAGAVTFADASAQSTVDDWSFELSVPAGTYDLIATTENGATQVDHRIAVRRGIVVTGDLALAGTVDVDTEGVALVPVALVPDAPLPAESGESLRAVVALQTTHSPVPAPVSEGLAASALVAPQALLIADDVQTAALEAVEVDAKTGSVAARGLRRSFRIGDATTFALPSGIAEAVWRVDASQPSVALPELPPKVDLLQVTATGTSGDGKSATYELDVSPTFLLATGGVADLTLDTVLPSYQAAWRIDFTRAYSLSAASSHKVDVGVEIASISKRVAP